jgi:trans-aconitate methyltransferase
MHHRRTGRERPVVKLKNEFARKEWKDCCGKGCKKCEIAQTYIKRYGRSDGLEKLNADRDTMKKAAKKGGKKSKKKAKA